MMLGFSFGERLDVDTGVEHGIERIKAIDGNILITYGQKLYLLLI